MAKTYRLQARFHPKFIASMKRQLEPKETLTAFVEKAMKQLSDDRRQLKEVLKRPPHE